MDLLRQNIARPMLYCLQRTIFRKDGLKNCLDISFVISCQLAMAQSPVKGRILGSATWKNLESATAGFFSTDNALIGCT